MKELIRIENLSKQFIRGDEKIQALDKINFSVLEKDFISIIGPSGSGKSTLLYILGLLDKQSSGSYKFEGTETSYLNDNDRSILRNEKFGFIFQSFHLLPRLNALRNVMIPLSYNFSRNNRSKEVLELVGLKDRMHHLPNQLSGGQRQRVAIARALVNNPRIIFADEPTGNLDSKTGNEILELFQKLNESGVTILLVTHDTEIAKISKRQIRVKDGLLQEVQYVHS